MTANGAAPGGVGASVLLPLAVVFLVAWMCGAAATRLGQPRVLGQMVAGVLLGPTLFGAVAPTAHAALFGPEVTSAFSGISAIGLALFMFGIGLRFDHRGAAERSRLLPVASVAFGSLVPVALGALVAATVGASRRPDGVSQPEYLLFVGGALTVTAFPMLASILEDRRMLHTPFGSLATMTAAGDDAIAWCLLVTIVALGDDSPLAIARTLGLTALFVVLCLVLVPRVSPRLTAMVVGQGASSETAVGLLAVLALLGGAVTDGIGIYEIFGAFVVGAAVPFDPDLGEHVRRHFLPMVTAIFLPVFFVSSGLVTDLRSILALDALVLVVVLVLVGLMSKVLPLYGVLRAFGFARGEALAMGGLMSARGLMILIFINVGIQQGVIDDVTFSAFVLVAVVTTGLALPLYRRHFSDEVEEEHRARTVVVARADPRPVR
ncbi:cation:proton antiporter [Phycicoccus sp. CSK15P-2]|uniref:cation:proton antiporter n=1 Tax=Phycicoccus sp. CSK15P-2 TaxID=2807627 RepID=UPI001951A064|nr:cation:proton antiporter [Phycicoccus sp. CSK15P-2]MBM6406089.1 cation:proton antiporter [Phycicoccus sp. CSK15P-2]